MKFFAPKFRATRQDHVRKKLIKGQDIENRLKNKYNHQLKHTNIVLFGLGNVGCHVIENILKNRAIHRSLFNRQFNIVAVFDSSGFVFNGPTGGHASHKHALNDSTLTHLIQWKQKGNSLRVFPNISYYYTDLSVECLKTIFSIVFKIVFVFDFLGVI